MKYPRQLNQTCKFKANNKWYIADLDNLVLLEVNETIISVLDLCEKHNKLSIIAHLRESHNSEDLRSAFNQLEQFHELGFLFSHGVSDIIQDSDQKLPAKIFVPYRQYGSVCTRFANARLLEELSNLCQVVLQIPRDISDMDFQLGSNVNVEFVRFQERDTLHWILQIPPDSGILLLNSQSTTDSLLYQHLDIPILQYIRSAELKSKNALNNVLNSYNLMMPKDRLVVDSIWLPTFLKKHGICPDHLNFVPPGLSLNLSAENRVNKEARNIVNSLFTKHGEATKIILITAPFEISRSWEFAHQLSNLVPNSQIVLVGSSSNVSYTEKVSMVSLNDVDDLILLSLVLQVCDVSLTIGWAGAEAGILTQSLQSNIPSILVIQENNSGSIEMLNPRSYIVKIPSMDNRCLLSHVASIANQAHRLLDERVSSAFPDPALDNWQKCASDIYNLFRQGNQVTSRPLYSSWYGPAVFSKVFNPYKKTLRPYVYELPNFNSIPFTEGLVKALKNWHTDREIDVILKSIEKKEKSNNETE